MGEKEGSRQEDEHDDESSQHTLDTKQAGIVRKLSLGRSPGVFTPLLFDCKPELLINSSECLGSASISIRSGACPNGGTTHRITRFRNRTSHASRSCGR